MEGKTQETAAAKAGMSVRSARKWGSGPLPSETRHMCLASVAFLRRSHNGCSITLIRRVGSMSGLGAWFQENVRRAARLV